MSVSLMSQVWPLAASPVQKLVLLSLADEANDAGECWPSVALTCRRTGVKRRAVLYALAQLEAAGLLRRDLRAGHATHYFLTRAPDAPVHQMHGTRAPDAPPPVHVVHPETKEELNQREPEKNVPSERRVSATPKARVPVAEIVALYHARLPTLPRCEKLTKARAGYIRQRWLQDLPTLEAWGNYFADVSESDFLMGRAEPSRGRPPFRADLEWLTRPGNFAKVSEGKYHHD